MTNYLKQRQYWKGEKDRYVARTVAKAIEYLEQVDRNKQFFLWIDSFDPHEPWDPPSVYKYDENGNYCPDMKCPYDPDYAGKDEFLPTVLRWKAFTPRNSCTMSVCCMPNWSRFATSIWAFCWMPCGRLGFEENTLFLMVSDHGEPMGNGEHGHGIMRKCRPWPYEELSHIPMILALPASRPARESRLLYSPATWPPPSATGWA